jgi:hypothetical protein
MRGRAQQSDGGRGTRLATVIVIAAAAIMPMAFASTAGAQTDSTAVTIPGNPLTVYVGPLGECQSSYLVKGVVAGNFFYGGNQVGDCGFFLSFPTEVSGKPNPTAVEGRTFGFQGAAGPSLSGEHIYVPAEGGQSPVSGVGTAASPFTQTTTFLVKPGATPQAEIVETTTYVNGQPQFTSTYTVKNTSGAPFYFRALYAGDLYVNGDDRGIGVFLGGPPRFIGGQNTNSGVIGGFQEVTPWSAWQEAYWSSAEGPSEGDNGIWRDIETAAEIAPTTPVFNGHIEPVELDNGAGVEFDQNLLAGLAAGKEASFTIVNRTAIPNALVFSPVSQTLTQGQTETVTATALDTASQPYAGKALRYTVAGGNPQSGAVTLNSAGQAQISYVGNNAGIDTIQMYVDLGGTGVQTSGDPSGTATVTFLPKPPPTPTPTPNSSYTIQSIHANSDGTITIVFVPTQSGAATLEVTVPTGTISRRDASAAKKKKCKKNQIKIKGKCRPKTTVSGRVSATGVGGVPLKLTVKPSSKVKKALKKGRTVTLTATLTYKSALGGTPTVKVFHFKVKPKKKHHH